GYPRAGSGRGSTDEPPGAGDEAYHAAEPRDPGRRRRPVTAPVYPPAEPAEPDPRTSVTVLQGAGPHFGGLDAADRADELQERVFADLTRLTNDSAPQPDLLVVTGNLTDGGGPREFAVANEFLTGLRILLGLELHRLVLVPGDRDVSRRACAAYFAACGADEIEPRQPARPQR